MGYQGFSTTTPDPQALGQQAIDPPLKDEGLELERSEDERAGDSPESQENAYDVDSSLEAEIKSSEEYWLSAIEAKVLVPAEADDETFFRKETAPDCLEYPNVEGKKAFSRTERNSILAYYTSDRATEKTTAERERNVRMMAEIALVQAFADLSLFKKSVQRELSVAANPYLAASITERADLLDLQKTRDRVDDLSKVHTNFEHYVAQTNQLLQAYYRKFGDAAGHQFINQLNQELYVQLKKEQGPAKEEGKLSEYQGICDSLLGGISFADILTKLDRVIALEQKSQAAAAAGQEQSTDDHASLQDAKSALRDDLTQVTSPDGSAPDAEQAAVDPTAQATTSTSPQSVVEPYEDAPDAKTE